MPISRLKKVLNAGHDRVVRIVEAAKARRTELDVFKQRSLTRIIELKTVPTVFEDSPEKLAQELIKNGKGKSQEELVKLAMELGMHRGRVEGYQAGLNFINGIINTQ